MISLKIKIGLILLAGLALSLNISAKEVVNINADWKFVKSNPTNASQTSFDDSGWEQIALPHTWNAFDGQDGGNNYYRGIGWYRKQISISAEHNDKTIYLKIGAANTSSSVYVNGSLVGTHTGGYAAFMFDITNWVVFGQNNVIAIQVDNSASIICPPLSADFTFYGGITRDVELLIANATHINPNEYISNALTVDGFWVAQPGVIIKQSNVSESNADLAIITKLRNTSLVSVNAIVEVLIKDANGTVVKTLSDSKSIIANDTASLVINTNMVNPRLWDGLNNPYLYRVELNLKVNGQVVDNSIQPLGLRYFSVDPDLGFFLNGKSYPLRGICLHEEKKDKGRAISDADRKEALDLLLETGTNYLRLSHYQHGDFTYHYLDSMGIVCWAEIPAVNSVGANIDENRTYRKYAVSQMYELIRQQYNHPSVIFWGLTNEINYKPGISPVGTVNQLNQVVKSEDTYRLTTLAAMYSERETNWIPDTYANNRYDGWYYNTIADFGPIMDALHAKYPTRKIGVSEYGVGANINQHEHPANKPNEGGNWHPEEYQNVFHEGYLKMINARPYLWGTSMWAGIDFASDGRNEGAQPGINDKGLITFDKSVKKDAFYWYKANWNTTERFVYISSRRFTSRQSIYLQIKMYSNCTTVTLKVNGNVVGTKTSEDHIFSWDNVTMLEGSNQIEAIGHFDGIDYTDQVVWNCTDATPLPQYPEVPSGQIQINFQKTSTTATPSGYLKDDGNAYGDKGNGYSYGWNTNLTANNRERMVADDKRFDTFMQMQTSANSTWSIDLPNQWYKVSMAVGDPNFTDSNHKIEANGVLIVNYLPTTANKFGAGTAYSKVTDGKMLVKTATGSTNAKINFIHITPVSDEEATTSISEISIKKKITAYFHKGMLNIENKNGNIDRIELYNLSGQLLLEQFKLSEKVQIQANTFQEGMYLLKIWSGDEISNLKLTAN